MSTFTDQLSPIKRPSKQPIRLNKPRARKTRQSEHLPTPSTGRVPQGVREGPPFESGFIQEGAQMEFPTLFLMSEAPF